MTAEPIILEQHDAGWLLLTLIARNAVWRTWPIPIYIVSQTMAGRSLIPDGGRTCRR